MEARLTDGNCEIILAVKSGRAIRFPESKVRPTGRGAIGVFGIEVNNENDEVIGMICANKNDVESTVLVVSEKGFGKRTSVDEYRVTNRGGKGVKTINITEKTGQLVGIMDVKDKDDLLITCKSGIILRTPVFNIKEAGSATQGVILIRLDEDDAIAGISKVEEGEVEEDVAAIADGETETTGNPPSEISNSENTDNELPSTDISE